MNERKKILIIAHKSRFFVQFLLDDISLLQGMGYEVHCATDFKGEDMITDAAQTLRARGAVLHQIEIRRSPYNVQNIKAYRALKELMKEQNYTAVFCHTPMGGVVGRLAAQSADVRPAIYMAHGFHFYKGCPLKNRLLYETMERFLARYTDALITINEEDYQAAQTFKLRGKAYKVNGVGVDVAKISGLKADRPAMRRDLNLPENAEVFLSVGELIPRKNHITALKAFAKAGIPNSYYLICGSGPEEKNLKAVAKELGIEDRVQLLGFRSDIYELLHAVDVFCFPSEREGLPVALMEAMAAGVPCLASRIRGNVDLLGEEYKYLFNSEDKATLSRQMHEVLDEKQTCAAECQRRIQAFDLENVRMQMGKVLEELITEQVISQK